MAVSEVMEVPLFLTMVETNTKLWSSIFRWFGGTPMTLEPPNMATSKSGWGFSPLKNISQLGWFFLIYGQQWSCSKPPTRNRSYFGDHCHRHQQLSSTQPHTSRGKVVTGLWLILEADQKGGGSARSIDPEILGFITGWWCKNHLEKWYDSGIDSG